MAVSRAEVPHPFQGVKLGTPDRPCTLCGKADRDPIHARRIEFELFMLTMVRDREWVIEWRTTGLVEPLTQSAHVGLVASMLADRVHIHERTLRGF